MEENRPNIDDSRNLLVSDSDEEEETVFDYQSQNDKQIGKQLILLFTWGTMGLIYSIPGPNLLAIACKINIPLDKIGTIFVGRSIGSVCGQLLSNQLIHRIKGYGNMSLSLITMVVFLAVFPLANNIDGAICMMIALGGAYGMTAEGYRNMDISNGLYKAGDLNKKAFALSIGAGLAPVISSPFLSTFTKVTNFSNQTATKSTTLPNSMKDRNSIFPGTVCPQDTDFAKSFWLISAPCIILLLVFCYTIFQSSGNQVTNESGSQAVRSSRDWKVYSFHFVLFAVVFFYRGLYRIAELVIFTYIILGPFDINITKASLLVMMLWAAFAFGHIMQHIVLLKVVRAERRLGITFFKACICFVMSILLLKIDNSNALTISLFVYMFFVSELGPLAQEILLNQGIITEPLARKISMYADAMAEAIFPVASLALMHSKGWQALAFVILVISVLQFLACTFLALCPLAVKRDMFSLNYENLSLNTQEDGNGRKIRKEIKKLLGGYTDHEVSYVTSEEEVVFDKKKRQKVNKCMRI